MLISLSLFFLFVFVRLCLQICAPLCFGSCFRVAAVCVIRSLSQGSANAAVLDVTQTGGHKKRVRRSSFLNAKKLYEDAQMARKVKQYLSNLSLETNEESLQTLSLQCEPSISTCESVAHKHIKVSGVLQNLIGNMNIMYKMISAPCRETISGV